MLIDTLLLTDPAKLALLPTVPVALLSRMPELLSIVIAEVLFSFSNVAAVESYAGRLPPRQRLRALQWGYAGALGLRAGSLLLMTLVKSYYWILLLASIQMVFGAAIWFFGFTPQGHGSQPHVVRALKPVRSDMAFLKAMILIEIADLGSSFENVAVAVSISKELWVSVTGVAIGLLFVRFYWQRLRSLLAKHPKIADICELVSGLLGIQILVKLLFDWQPSPWIDLLIVVAAIFVSRNCRRLGTRMRKQATIAIFALLLCFSLWFSL